MRKRIMTLAAVLAIHGAAYVFGEGAPKHRAGSGPAGLESIADTIKIPSEIVTQNMVKAQTEVNSHPPVSPLYDSLDNAIAYAKSSGIIDEKFLKSFIRAMHMNPAQYTQSQKRTRDALDRLDYDGASGIVTKDFVKSISRVESNQGRDTISPTGARGPMQIVPATWVAYCDDPYKKNVFNPEKNVEIGLKHLLWLEDFISKKNKRWESLSDDQKKDQIAAAYNGGHGLLLSKSFDIRKMYLETVSYVDKVRDAMVVVGLEALLDLGKKMDVQERIDGIMTSLAGIERFFSENYHGWKREDVDFKRDVMAAATMMGPRYVLEKVKEKHDFRNIPRFVRNLMEDVDEYIHIENIADSWTDPSQMHIGISHLLDIEDELSRFYPGWDYISPIFKQRYVLAGSVAGIKKLKESNWDLTALPKYSQEKIMKLDSTLRKLDVDFGNIKFHKPIYVFGSEE